MSYKRIYKYLTSSFIDESKPARSNPFTSPSARCVTALSNKIWLCKQDLDVQIVSIPTHAVSSRDFSEFGRLLIVRDIAGGTLANGKEVAVVLLIGKTGGSAPIKQNIAIVCSTDGSEMCVLRLAMSQLLLTYNCDLVYRLYRFQNIIMITLDVAMGLSMQSKEMF